MKSGDLRRSERRLKHGAAILVSLLAPMILLGFGGCRQNDNCGAEADPPVGFFSDTPLPRLCLSDTLTLGSGTDLGVLTDAAVDAQATDTTSGSTVGLFVLGQRDTKQPHENAHVDIELRPPVLAQLETKSSACRLLSSSRLACILNSQGYAYFSMRPFPDARGTQTVVATSGLAPERTLSLAVGEIDSLGVIEVSNVTVQRRLPNVGEPLRCGLEPDTTNRCSTVTVATLQATSSSPPVRATKTTALLQGELPTSTWLAPSPSCDPKGALETEVTFRANSRTSDPFYICTDGAETEATVTILAGRQDADGGNPGKRIKLGGVPDSITVQLVNDAGLVTEVRDCVGRGIPATRTAIAGIGSGRATDAGITTFELGPQDGGTDATTRNLRISVESTQVVATTGTCNLEVTPK